VNTNGLSVGLNPEPLIFPHFPTRLQAVVWRNWELVPVERLAAVLETGEDNVLRLALDMGLRVPPHPGRLWLQRGFLTIIRANWHLLPYDQLLLLLGWTTEKLAYTLKEEDVLWHKLGDLKPRSEPVKYRPLTPEEQKSTVALKAIVERHFPDIAAEDHERPFGFLAGFREPGPRWKQSRKDHTFDLRLIYSYSAVYGDPLLDRTLDPYPDGLLARLAGLGINGVWLQGILYTLIPMESDPQWGEGHEKRLETLTDLTERAAKFGIGVYLYLNEPRGMPLRFFDRHPEWKGAESNQGEMFCLCTSHPPVLDYVRRATSTLFRRVPRLAGVFTITMSENATNCYSRGMVETPCPRCASRRVEDIVVEVNRAIEQGVHSAKPGARVIVWTWAWEPEWAHRAIDLLPENVEIMCTSEEALPTNVGGISNTVIDYSISQVGPGERAKGYWNYARKRGLKAIAKVQINSTWECSGVPYIPTPDLVEQHIGNLAETGVDGLMLSWTTGGYPSGNLELLSISGQDMARKKFGKEAAPVLLEAWHVFSEAFKEFPFHVDVLYRGPQNYGPMNLLHAKPSGYSATMLGFPYDDLESWRAIYPEDVFENQFRKLTEVWVRGLQILQEAKPKVDPDKEAGFADLERVARAAYCHFRSTYLQAAFVRLREREDTQARGRIETILDEEIRIAKELHDIARLDSRIGFEASNHYYYTLNDLREKVLNCEYLKKAM